ncbi:cellulose binding domain-containing protein [Halomonas nitroreducens]|uniref:Alginate biosynthesis protein n=1 Tax=Halomonas nitroreducens TaxID=447425 RepID=A0A431V0A9_9GAMM|nr:cellulose binding domain-containing protein [Halomonas nitroreducens]RTR00506.1 alginate biosynthesis protein [Halomonas nitroreducens]
MTTIDIDLSITADELQTLIDEAPSGATLRFAAGHYEFDDALTISRSDISLIGAGAGETMLTFTDSALSGNDYAIRLDGTEKTYERELAADISEGSRQLTLAEGHDLQVGDTLRIWQDNDDAFFDEIGDTSWRKVQYAELRTSMARIESVEGSTVTLDRGVHFDFEGGKTQVARMETVDNVSLEGFSVDFSLGSPEPGTFENTLEALTGYNAILLTGTTDTQLSDIRVNDGPSTAFRFSRTLDPVAEDLEAHGAFNKGSGGNGYAYELHESYDGQFTGLEDSGMRHSLVFASWRSSVGNEVEVAFTDRDINFHGGRDHDNSVRVLSSIRDPETDALSPALYVNEEGESFGAPTDPEANEVLFDYLIGSRRDDEVQGSDDGVYLNGGLGHDTLSGGNGDDLLQGGPGDDWYDGTDTLDGGQGIDTARYTGAFADHDIQFAESGVIITGQGSQDTLTDMEFAVFGDGITLHLESGNAFRGSPLEMPSPEDILSGGGDDPALKITSQVTSSWSSGYVAEVFVENVSDEAIVNPEVGFDLAADIDTLWNGDVTRATDRYWVRDDSDITLAPGDSWRFAYKAYGEESTPSQVAARDEDGQPLEILGKGGATPALLDDDAEMLVTGNVTSRWSSGYVAEVFVENVSDDEIIDPELAFDLPADIDTLWNGEVIEGVEGYRARDDSDLTLAPGETWRFAFKAYGEDTLPAEMTAQDAAGQALDVQVLGLGSTAIEEVAG